MPVVRQPWVPAAPPGVARRKQNPGTPGFGFCVATIFSSLRDTFFALAAD